MNYGEFLKGKRVVIVGPAPTIVGSGQHDLIESYDVVVRINKALPVPENLKPDIGSRTDVLYNCLNQHPENGGKIDLPLLQSTVQWLCCPYPEIPPFNRDIAKFRKQSNDSIPFHVIDKQHYVSIADKIGTRPNSGIGAILDLLNHDISELYVTGFTFFKGGYYFQYRKKTEEQVMDRMRVGGNHHQEPQIDLVKHLFATDTRLSGDEALMEILR